MLRHVRMYEAINAFLDLITFPTCAFKQASKHYYSKNYGVLSILCNVAPCKTKKSTRAYSEQDDAKKNFTFQAIDWVIFVQCNDRTQPKCEAKWMSRRKHQTFSCRPLPSSSWKVFHLHYDSIWRNRKIYAGFFTLCHSRIVLQLHSKIDIWMNVNKAWSRLQSQHDSKWHTIETWMQSMYRYHGAGFNRNDIISHSAWFIS